MKKGVCSTDMKLYEDVCVLINTAGGKAAGKFQLVA